MLPLHVTTATQAGPVPTCAEGGVLGVLPGIVGSMQALEAIKLLCGIGKPLIGKLLHVDTLGMAFRTFTLRRDVRTPRSQCQSKHHRTD